MAEANAPGGPEDLYENAPCGLLVTSSSGLIQRVNGTFCRWLGYGAEELVQRRRLADLLTMGGKIFHQTHWLPLLQMQGSVAEVQLDFAHRDRRTLPALVNAVRRSGGRDELAVFVATDRRKYERELLRARHAAEALLVSERAAQSAVTELLREKESEAQQRAVLAEQLIGIVSHDLRTPLQSVLMGASLLGSQTLNEAQQARTIGRIVSAANRSTRLTSDLLDFTQARLGGGLRVHARPMDLHALVADGAEELRAAWPGRQLLHQATGPGACVADPDRLAQVLTNLVNNALTYGDPDQPVVLASAVDPQGLRLSVHNRGKAIPEALRPHLFEPLRRGEQQMKLGSRSVGLGLYIVQQIAVAHGGQVTVTSTEAEGTCFEVSVPAPK